MKKVLSIIVALAFVLGAVPVFAQESGAEKEKNLVQQVGDSLKDFKIREQDKIKTAKKITLFQSMSDTLKKGSSNAKNLSKRTPK
jgi:uncharacterized protein YxeA